MRILNGRMIGDILGNFTTFKNGHTSVNDYGIVSEKFYSGIENFIVLPQTTVADNSEIVISIKNILVPNIDSDGDREEWYPLEKRRTWDIDYLSSNAEKSRKHL